MPEEEKKQDLVDIDTSGPGAEVELEEEKVKEEEVERRNSSACKSIFSRTARPLSMLVRLSIS